ncbi:methylenetetrahydrofolate reductase [Candidatus Woesearchaeota archaeon]|nr:methylenetetrahydrofolate reductase [Candidatus Woesearchaeota archaeon]
MKKITEILKEKKFTISVEIVPPRNGTDPNELFGKLHKIRNRVDFLSVTKGAGGSLRGGTLPISYLVKEKYGINTIAHFVCRERTKEEIENELCDLNYLNIKNILALRGDPPAMSNEEWRGEYKYAYLLVKQIAEMNKGRYLPRKGQDENFREGMKTDFCIIVAGHPEDPIEEEIKHMKCKADAGAEVIITQMVFSFEEYKKYAESLKKNGIKLPALAGIRPLTSLQQAESTEKFFGLKVCNELKKGLAKGGRDFGMKYCAEMIRKLRNYGALGAHLFILNEIDLTLELLDMV